MSHAPRIAFFDMDHTLIDNDCDVSWKEFLICEGLADREELLDVARFYDLYREGQLPIDDFLAFQLRQFVGRDLAEMQSLAQRHFDDFVADRIYPEARAEIEQAHANGIPTVMLTGTNSIVAEPLARTLGMSHVIGTELEMAEGLFTGRIVDPYCYEYGKVTRAEEYCASRDFSLEHALYFGDSIADIPMLSSVGSPVAVNPGDQLQSLATERGWRIALWSL